MANARPMSLPGLLLRHAGPATLAIVLASFFANLLVLASPLFMLQVYDRVLLSRSVETLILLTVAVTLLFIMMSLLERGRADLLNRIAAKVTLELADKAFDATFRNQLRQPQAAAWSRANADVDVIRQFLTGPGIPAFVDLPWAPLFIIAAYLISPLIGHMTLAAAIILFGLTLASELAARRPTRAGAARAAKAAGFAETSLESAQTIRAMGMMPGIRDRWSETQRAGLAFQMQAAHRSSALATVSRFIRIAVQSFVLAAGAWLAIKQEITPGMIVAGSIILGRGLGPIEQVVGAWRGFAAARGALERIDRLTRDNPEPLSRHVALPAPAGAVAVEQVVVVPPGSETPILKGISFAVPAGRSVGIVGASGAGKSTLAKVLVGAVVPARGTVRIDGAAMADWPAETLGPHVGYLPQEIDLLDGTVAENIARFGPIDSEKVVAAAQAAGVHDLILRLPHGYETMIGAAGRALSGGQRQRIGLARALYGEPVLLVLDEPNANLDAEGETALQQAIAAAAQRGATIFMISHRVALIAPLDMVMVVGDGTVQAFGPSAEVIARLQGGGQKPQPRAVAQEGRP
ncbi:type I secretion system permease/ATPase [Zavarzinia compransoris]|nr:type I secretion system permease/ATPase [Zavarzinia marina]